MASVRRPKGTRPGVSEQTSPRGVLDLQSSFASSTSDGGSVFGPPFTFGKALAFNRHPPDYLREFPQIDHPSPLGSTWPAKLHSSKTFTATAKHSGKRSSSPSALSTHTVVRAGKVRTNELESCSTTRRRHAATKSRPHSDLENAELDEVPGPGYYNILPALAKQQQGPAFTMGSRPLVKAPVNDTAEPLASAETTHSPGRPSTTGGFTMGARPRHTFAKGCDTPGPGAYNKAAGTSPQGPAYTFPISRTLLTGGSDRTPAVGQYDVAKDVASGPAFTVPSTGREPNIVRTHALPGPAPGQYDPTLPSHAPAWGFGKAPDPDALLPTSRANSKPAMPAVGSYNLPPAWLDGPAYSIGGKPAAADAGASAKCADTAKSAASAVPGPGYYAVEVPAAQGPAFSMGARHALGEAQGASSPGPAAPYQRIAYEPTGPAFSILGRIEAPGTPKQSVPGPGAYQPTPTKCGPAYTIAGRALESKPAAGVPGVGAYDVAVESKAPAFTIAGRPTDAGQLSAADLPGPGAYSVDPLKPANPAFTFGHRRWAAEEAASDAPGPGDYSIEKQAWRDGPAFTISQASGKAVSKLVDTPGPGEYAAEYDAVDRKAPSFAFTIAERPAVIPTSDTPAPGAYTPPKPLPGPAFTIATRPTGDDARCPTVITPGPGEYDSAATGMPQGPAFTIGTRPAASVKVEPAVGPGQYNVPTSALNGPAFTIAGRSKEAQEPQPTPGPAHYAEPSAPATTPAFTIGIRREEVAAESDAPAVGTYNPNKAVALQSTPAFTIGRSARQQAAAQDVPGPGEYDGQAALPEGQAYTIPKARRPQLATAELDAPAPGDYHTDNTLGEAAPAFTIAPRIAASSKAQDGPSPADYMPHPLPTGPAFTAAGRTALPSDKVELGPGPAEYDTAKYGRQEGPAFTIAARYPPTKAQKAAESEPGPGAHDPLPVMQNKAPAFSMARKTKQPAANNPADLPAPGDYHAASSLPTGPAYSLPTAKRALASHADAGNTPAPGDYHVDFVSRPAAETHKQANPLASKPRAPKHAEDTPGPTDFDPQLPKSSAPAYTMGKRTKAMLSGDKENARIGPEYDLPGTGRGAAFTMAGKPMEPHEEPTPGPGHFYEMKSFPQPLGKVVSILKRHDSDVQITKWKHVTFSPSAAARLADN